jgi:exopolyphosphatase / guanosine-5'-triphosphate,3'-diphosphate pyrophosphatase
MPKLRAEARPVRVAALDVGSNSFHAVVLEARPDGTLRRVGRAKEMVRLGEVTLRVGTIPRRCFQRGLAALRTLAREVATLEPHATVAVATSTVREASNGRFFVESARIHSGFDIQVIDGEEEAGLIYRGAGRGLPGGGRRVALFDVGGGSTEAIVGQAGLVEHRTSLKLGSLRLAGEVPAEPSSAKQLAAMTEQVRDVLRPAMRRIAALAPDYLALSSGTAVALARMTGEPLAPRAGVRRFMLGRKQLRAATARLAAVPAAERVDVAGVHPRRADTILAGAIIVGGILDAAGRDEALVVDAALREGMVVDWLARTGYGPWAGAWSESPARRPLRMAGA